MTHLPTYLSRLYTAPPTEIYTRNLENQKLFDEMWRSIRWPATPEEANQVDHRLLCNNHQYHPYIHSGYYDSKKKNVLYVKDKFTGKSIPKATAVLLSSGEFTAKTSPYILRPFESPEDYAELNLALKDETTTKDITKCFIKVDTAYDVYVPFNPHQYARVLSGNSLARYIKDAFTAFAEREHFILSPTGANFTPGVFNAFSEYLQQHFVGVDAYSTIEYKALGFSEKVVALSDRAEILAGCYLKNSNWISFGEYIHNTPPEECPLLCLNTGRTLSAGQVRELRIYEFPFLYNFPLRLGVEVIEQASTSLTRNKKTKNNDGILMSYSSRVPDYKVSFLMTEAEELRFKGIEQSFTTKEQQYKQDKKKLQDMLNLPLDYAEERKIRQQIKALKPPRIQCDASPIFIGLELELVPKTNSEQERMDIVKTMSNTPFGDHMLAKFDRSIETNPQGQTVYGLEIVTIPATLKYHKKVFDEHFFDAGNSVHKKLMSNANCGIHVHVDKKAFTRLTLGKYLAFINSRANQNFIDDFAGRGENRYCEKLYMKGKNTKGIDQSVVVARKVNMTGRSENFPRGATNLSTTDKTVEVRIFKSASSRNNIFRKLEFCVALVHFCRVTSFQNLTAYHFVEFLLEKENKKEYPCLIRWLASRNYIEHTRQRVNKINKLVHVYGTNKIPKPTTSLTQ